MMKTEKGTAVQCSVTYFILFNKGWQNNLHFWTISPCIIKAVTILHTFKFFKIFDIIIYKVRQWWENSQN